LIVALALVVSAGSCERPRSQGHWAAIEEELVLPDLEAEDCEAMGIWVAGLYAETPQRSRDVPRALRTGRGTAYVALRREGQLLAEAWGPEGDLDESVAGAVAEARRKLAVAPGSRPGAPAEADLIELDLAHAFHRIERPTLKAIRAQVSNRSLGIRGLELSLGEERQRWAPSAMIAQNLKVRNGVRSFWRKVDVDEQQFLERGGRARWFEAQQFLVSLPAGETQKMSRGNVFVEPDQVTQASTRVSADLLTQWLLAHLHEDGRMTYLWSPATSRESRENNMIRQWMLTTALIEINQRRQDPALWARIADNIDYNLRHFYRQEGEFGVIQYRGTVKLGALSLATMAIMAHPDRERWQTQERSLRRTVMSLWREGGEFTLFYRPRHQQQNAANFYPGETLLLWARLYAENRDPELLRRYVASHDFYRAWHLNPEHRRPAFVPWHTRASVEMWRTLGTVAPDSSPSDPAEGAGPHRATSPEGWAIGTAPSEPARLQREELVDWVFEMNDWMIAEMAVWDDALYRDERGRFHSRGRNFGNPHAALTGLSMEGLIEAHALARATGDEGHEERYRLTLARGLRSVQQLQFIDEVDLFYVTDKAAARGGLRTSIFHSDIRADSVQHVLMATLPVLESFGPEDYSSD